MAVIQKIRNQYGKLAGFVIALALVGFILMDAASGNLADTLGRDASVVTVNGEKVDIREYNLRVMEYEHLYSYSSQGQKIDDATRAQLSAQTLTEIINERIIREEAKKMGLRTTPEEERNLIYGAQPDLLIQQYPAFRNQETQTFDPSRIRGFEQQVDQFDPSGRTRKEWEALKAYVLRNNIIRKYSNMLSKASYTPRYLAERIIDEQNQYASMEFLHIDYSTVSDSLVPVSEKDMQEYLKRKAPLYTIDEPTRSIEYVSFDVVPSSEDTARVLEALASLKPELESTQQVESFVNRHSEDPYRGDWVNQSTFFSIYSDSLMALSEGEIFGPYFENGAYKLTKVVEKKRLPDSVTVRHILVRTENAGQPVATDEAARARLDSAIALLKSGADFATVVNQYTDDEGSIPTNGEYTFMLSQRAQISKEFADFSFEGKKGQTTVVKVSNPAYAGFHYIEILDQKAFKDALKLATLSKSLYPSQTTENTIYAQAAEFAGRNTMAQAFDEAVEKGGLNKKVAENVKANDFVLSGLGSSREVIRWMYEAKPGEISPIFSLDNRYVVAKLSAVKNPGLMKLDELIRPSIETAIRNEKKAERIIEKYRSAASMEELAKSTGLVIQQADSFSLSTPFIAGLGFEPKAVGLAFYPGLEKNRLSEPIEGQSGVIFVRLKYRWKSGEEPGTDQIDQTQIMLHRQLESTLGPGVQDMLRKSAKVEYNSQNL